MGPFYMKIYYVTLMLQHRPGTLRVGKQNPPLFQLPRLLPLNADDDDDDVGKRFTHWHTGTAMG